MSTCVRFGVVTGRSAGAVVRHVHSQHNPRLYGLVAAIQAHATILDCLKLFATSIELETSVLHRVSCTVLETACREADCLQIVFR